MQYAQVIDSKVANLLLWDGLTAPRPDDLPEGVEWAPFPNGIEGELVPVPDGAYVTLGATFEGGQFVSPEAPQVPAVAPAVVTMRQARLALLAAGMLDAVETALAGAPRAAQIEWEFAATVERSSPTVELLAGVLGLDDEALDALFADAASR